MPAVEIHHLSPGEVAIAESRFQNTGRIPMATLELSLSLLFALALLACLGRMLIRLTSRGKLQLDDSLLLFAVVCLASSTAIMFKVAPNYYLTQALIRGDPDAVAIAAPRLTTLSQHYNWTVANIILSWTAVFGVKASYFALFYPMMSVMSRRVVWFFWGSVGLSTAAWFVLAFGSNFILCKELGTAAVRCYFNNSRHGMLTLLAVTATLDGITNLTILIIPIFILQKTPFPSLSVKIGVGFFLLLSIFMLVCSIVRAAGVYYQGIIDCRWQSYWCQVEACIAVMMGSLTVYRSTLVGSGDGPNKLQSFFHRIFGRKTAQEDDKDILMHNAAKKGVKSGGSGSDDDTLVGTIDGDGKSVISLKHV